jgi:hypothetical protein
MLTRSRRWPKPATMSRAKSIAPCVAGREGSSSAIAGNPASEGLALGREGSASPGMVRGTTRVDGREEDESLRDGKGKDKMCVVGGGMRMTCGSRVSLSVWVGFGKGKITNLLDYLIEI